jgi:hypothetical protein
MWRPARAFFDSMHDSMDVILKSEGIPPAQFLSKPMEIVILLSYHYQSLLRSTTLSSTPFPALNKGPMKPKRHRHFHLRSRQLLHRRSIQGKKITEPRDPIEHHAQQHPVIFAAPRRVRNEDSLAGCVCVLLPDLVLLLHRVEFNDPI